MSLSRHPTDLIPWIILNIFVQNLSRLHGDRNVKDDKAIVGGLGKIEDQTVMIIGHQKNTTKMRQLQKFWYG